jgi:hypothetical protein
MSPPRTNLAIDSALCLYLALVVLVGSLLNGCSAQRAPHASMTEPTAPEVKTRSDTAMRPTGTLVYASHCVKPSGTDSKPTQHNCLQYEYDGVGLLHLTHLHTAFNYCPDQIVPTFEFRNETIRIRESEVLKNPCGCLCLYDVAYQIKDLPVAQYLIDVSQLHLSADEEVLRVLIDLSVTWKGQYCVERKQIPWSSFGRID